MKIRSSILIAPAAAPIALVLVAPIPLVSPDMSYLDARFWYTAASLYGIALVLALIGVAIPSIDIDEYRIKVRQRHGWTVMRQLHPGERWVLAHGRLWVLRLDGTFERQPRVSKRWVSRRDWGRLERFLAGR